MWKARPARSQRSPPGFIAPCIPTLAKVAPSGPIWVHEIKHDGYRIIARKDGERVRLWSRHGLSWTAAFPLIVEALRAMPADSVILDGEAVLECEDARHDFHGLRTAAARTPACLRSTFSPWMRRTCAQRRLRSDGNAWPLCWLARIPA